ncbi:polyprenyl diphosphate synthase [Streptomyces sp. NPDC052676]|uniref:polyprenyl diphosphate synthase n=1 Tax=Streptomyces sp. NPDC052676 TaxID=3154953 RepID=UPI0034122974
MGTSQEYFADQSVATQQSTPTDDKTAPGSATIRVPRHVALVMDGNGRWAAQRNRPRTHGHMAGQEIVFETIDAALSLGVSYLTVYVFSTENWRRTEKEVTTILTLVEDFLREREQDFLTRGVRVRWRGRAQGLPDSLVSALRHIEEATAGCDRLVYTMCVNHGGLAEIADAAREISQRVHDGELDPDRVGESTLADILTRTLPPWTCSSGPAANSACRTSCCGTTPTPNWSSPPPCGPTSGNAPCGKP